MQIFSYQHNFLFLAALLAGIINSVAGGGSFISFSALLFTGVNPIAANATTNTAMWLGTAASVSGYRAEIAGKKKQLLVFALVGIAGGLLGALLLLVTSANFFGHLIPYLLLCATLLFNFSSRVTKILQSHLPKWDEQKHPIALLVVQFVISIYGGFFGAGMGILMLAVLSVTELGNIHTMNAFKCFLGLCINGVAIIPFILAGVILWHQLVIMSCGAIIGGYLGAVYAQKLHPATVKRIVVFLGYTMSAYFFLRG
jgi:uncharacterized protein